MALDIGTVGSVTEELPEILTLELRLLPAGSLTVDTCLVPPSLIRLEVSMESRLVLVGAATLTAEP